MSPAGGGKGVDSTFHKYNTNHNRRENTNDLTFGRFVLYRRKNKSAYLLYFFTKYNYICKNELSICQEKI
jgi:hypothetical protein